MWPPNPLACATAAAGVYAACCMQGFVAPYPPSFDTACGAWGRSFGCAFPCCQAWLVHPATAPALYTKLNTLLWSHDCLWACFCGEGLGKASCSNACSCGGQLPGAVTSADGAAWRVTRPPCFAAAVGIAQQPVPKAVLTASCLGGVCWMCGSLQSLLCVAVLPSVDPGERSQYIQQRECRLACAPSPVPCCPYQTRESHPTSCFCPGAHAMAVCAASMVCQLCSAAGPWRALAQVPPTAQRNQGPCAGAKPICTTGPATGFATGRKS